MKVDIIKPQVDRFVFPVRHGVNVFASGRLLNFGLRHWPSFLLDVGAGADLLRYWKETVAELSFSGFFGFFELEKFKTSPLVSAHPS